MDLTTLTHHTQAGNIGTFFEALIEKYSLEESEYNVKESFLECWNEAVLQVQGGAAVKELEIQNIYGIQRYHKTFGSGKTILESSSALAALLLAVFNKSFKAFKNVDQVLRNYTLDNPAFIVVTFEHKSNVFCLKKEAIYRPRLGQSTWSTTLTCTSDPDFQIPMNLLEQAFGDYNGFLNRSVVTQDVDTTSWLTSLKSARSRNLILEHYFCLNELRLYADKKCKQNEASERKLKSDLLTKKQLEDILQSRGISSSPSETAESLSRHLERYNELNKILQSSYEEKSVLEEELAQSVLSAERLKTSMTSKEKILHQIQQVKVNPECDCCRGNILVQDAHQQLENYNCEKEEYASLQDNIAHLEQKLQNLKNTICESQDEIEMKTVLIQRMQSELSSSIELHSTTEKIKQLGEEIEKAEKELTHHNEWKIFSEALETKNAQALLVHIVGIKNETDYRFENLSNKEKLEHFLNLKLQFQQYFTTNFGSRSSFQVFSDN
jgi:hypothetical protein